MGGGGLLEKSLPLEGVDANIFWNYRLYSVTVHIFQEQIGILLGGSEKVDAHHISSCVSYCKEKYTLWRADIRKKVEINDDSV